MTKYEKLSQMLSEVKRFMVEEGISDFAIIDASRNEPIKVNLKSGQREADAFLKDTKRGAYCENGKTKHYVDRIGNVGEVTFISTATC